MRILTAVGLALATLAVTSPAVAQDFRWTGSVERGDAVEIRGIMGDIVATRASGGQVEVLATKSAEKSDPATVSIEVVEDSEGVLICALYPSKEGKEPNQCARGSDYQMNMDENDVQVAFTVRVPAGVDLHASNVNGGVTATGLASDVRAETVNGEVQVETSGQASAETVNGSIVAALGSITAAPLSFETVNGNITLTLPEGTQASVVAETLNGELNSDFELTVKGRFRAGMRKLEGDIGSGGSKISLETVNGSIRLKKGG
jgi:hypothetical protein